MKKQITIWFISILLLSFLIALLVLIFKENEGPYIGVDDSDVKISESYDNKLVYADTDDPELVDKYKNDCQSRGGQFDECGSPCAPEDDVCIQVCAYTCTLNDQDQDNNQNDQSWLKYENQDLQFSISHPQDVNVEITQNGDVEFQLLGSDQDNFTEIYDGLRLLVSDFSHDPNLSLRDAIERQIRENILPAGELSQELKVDNTYDLATYNYAVDTLGTFNHYLVPVYPGLAFDLSYFASDSNYEDIAKRMIKSFEVEGEDKMDTKIDDVIEVESPKLSQTISSPVDIRGRARGTWFFEGVFSIVLTDWDGRIIGETQAQSDSSWMTEEFIDFYASLDYEIDQDVYSPRANIIFQKSNPSGLAENDESLEYPVYLQLQ